jgi:hypothetical protein
VVPARRARDELCLQPRVCLTLLFSFCVFQGGALSARGCRKGAPWASGKWELGRSMLGAVRSGVPARPRHLARQCPGRGPPGASLTLARHPRPAPVGSFGTGVAHRGRPGRAQALCCPLRLQSPLHGRSAAAGGRPGTNSVVTGRPHRGARRRRFQAAGVVVKVEPWGVLAAGWGGGGRAQAAAAPARGSRPRARPAASAGARLGHREASLGGLWAGAWRELWLKNSSSRGSRGVGPGAHQRQGVEGHAGAPWRHVGCGAGGGAGARAPMATTLRRRAAVRGAAGAGRPAPARAGRGAGAGGGPRGGPGGGGSGLGPGPRRRGREGAVRLVGARVPVGHGMPRGHGNWGCKAQGVFCKARSLVAGHAGGRGPQERAPRAQARQGAQRGRGRGRPGPAGREHNRLSADTQVVQ